MRAVAGTLTIKTNEGFGARHDAVVYARSIVKMVAQYADGGLTDRADLISVLEALGLVDKLLETAADLIGEEPEVAAAEPFALASAKTRKAAQLAAKTVRRRKAVRL